MNSVQTFPTFFFKVLFNIIPSYIIIIIKIQDSSVGITMGYELDIWISIPGRSKRFFSTPQLPRPALGPIKPHNKWVSGAISPGVRWPGREDDHSSPSSAEVKNGGAIPTLPIYVHSRHSA
jgi:hypothetical protein